MTSVDVGLIEINEGNYSQRERSVLVSAVSS